jgi:hypothetical protein
MGVNATIIVVKPLGEKRYDAAQILKELCVTVAIEQDDLDFETTLGRQWDQSSAAATAAATYKDKVIFVLGHNIDLDVIQQFTAAYPAEALLVNNSDTTDVAEFCFWVNGELVRKVSLGLEKWIDELKAAGITDEEILKRHEDVDVGNPLEFEKDSSHPMDVLSIYALDYFDFYDLRWTIYRSASTIKLDI